MKRCLLFVLAALLAAPALAAAQSSDEEVIAKAIQAAPQRVRVGAGVVRWDANNNRIVVKESENGLVCWDRSDVPGTAPFAMQCSAEANLPRFEQNRKFAFAAADADERRAMMDAAEADGTRVLAKFGTVWYSLNGPDAGERPARTRRLPSPTRPPRRWACPTRGARTASGSCRRVRRAPT